MDIGIGLPNTVPGTEGRRHSWLGDAARQIAAGAAVSTEMVKSHVAAFASVGCDELIFIPTSSSPDQIALLATAVL